MSETSASILAIPAYRAAQFRVDAGANMGDNLGVFDDLVLDDVYELRNANAPRRLSVAAFRDGRLAVAQDTQMGAVDADLHLDCSLTLMPARGANVEALVAVEVDAEGMIAEIYLLPLAPLKADQGYTLVKAERAETRRKLAQIACVSFSRGTHITLASGAQRQIEDLMVGDRVLTRDDGPQAIRWIGQTTSRAVGALAPILIRKGALNNAEDLVVSPDHKLMVYQRTDAIGTGVPEVLVRARDLVNGSSVVVQDGGYIDYFQILFDRHHIIYAEGIAAETLFLDPFTEPALPADLLSQMRKPDDARQSLPFVETVKGQLPKGDAAAILKEASRR
ncbi:Hint domain-containing protein [Epibacterium ulvae]|nr:Hint domain-containing protein [Epibacterium ulvae]